MENIKKDNIYLNLNEDPILEKSAKSPPKIKDSNLIKDF